MTGTSRTIGLLVESNKVWIIGDKTLYEVRRSDRLDVTPLPGSWVTLVTCVLLGRSTYEITGVLKDTPPLMSRNLKGQLNCQAKIIVVGTNKIWSPILGIIVDNALAANKHRWDTIYKATLYWNKEQMAFELKKLSDATIDTTCKEGDFHKLLDEYKNCEAMGERLIQKLPAPPIAAQATAIIDLTPRKVTERKEQTRNTTKETFQPCTPKTMPISRLVNLNNRDHEELPRRNLMSEEDSMDSLPPWSFGVIVKRSDDGKSFVIYLDQVGGVVANLSTRIVTIDHNAQPRIGMLVALQYKRINCDFEVEQGFTEHYCYTATYIDYLPRQTIRNSTRGFGGPLVKYRSNAMGLVVVVKALYNGEEFVVQTRQPPKRILFSARDHDNRISDPIKENEYAVKMVVMYTPDCSARLVWEIVDYDPFRSDWAKELDGVSEQENFSNSNSIPLEAGGKQSHVSRDGISRFGAPDLNMPPVTHNSINRDPPMRSSRDQRYPNVIRPRLTDPFKECTSTNSLTQGTTPKNKFRDPPPSTCGVIDDHNQQTAPTSAANNKTQIEPKLSKYKHPRSADGWQYGLAYLRRWTNENGVRHEELKIWSVDNVVHKAIFDKEKYLSILGKWLEFKLIMTSDRFADQIQVASLNDVCGFPEARCRKGKTEIMLELTYVGKKDQHVFSNDLVGLINFPNFGVDYSRDEAYTLWMNVDIMLKPSLGEVPKSKMTEETIKWGDGVDFSSSEDESDDDDEVIHVKIQTETVQVQRESVKNEVNDEPLAFSNEETFIDEHMDSCIQQGTLKDQRCMKKEMTWREIVEKIMEIPQIMVFIENYNPPRPH